MVASVRARVHVCAEEFLAQFAGEVVIVAECFIYLLLDAEEAEGGEGVVWVGDLGVECADDAEGYEGAVVLHG